jgi:hypothetical protein
MKDFTRVYINNGVQVIKSTQKNTFNVSNQGSIKVVDVNILSDQKKSGRIENSKRLIFTPKNSNYNSLLFHVTLKYQTMASYSTQIIRIVRGSQYKLVHYGQGQGNKDYDDYIQLYTGSDNNVRAYFPMTANTLYHLDLYWANGVYKLYMNGIWVLNCTFGRPSSIELCTDSQTSKWYRTGWWQDCGVICDIDEKDLDLENRGDELILPSYLKDYFTFPTYSANRTLYGIK